VAEGRLNERGNAAARRIHVDLNRCSGPADLHAVLPQLLRCRESKLETVDGLDVRFVPAALDPGGEAELVEKLRELARGGVDHLHVPLFLLVEVAHAHDRLRETVDRRQRRSEVVRRERNEVREGLVGALHERDDTNLSA
jgi:hypothetical protein